MDYRGFWIRRNVWQGRTFYRAEYTPKGSTLARYVATDPDSIGILRAVDDYITTGRRQFRAG